MKSVEAFLSEQRQDKTAEHLTDVGTAAEKADFEAALAAVTDYFSRVGPGRATSGRVRAYLLKKDFAEQVVESVVAELDETGYLNDYECALALIAGRRGGKAEAVSALRRRMYRLGISAAAIAAALSEMDVSEEERALEFLLAKRRRDLEELKLLLDDQKAYYKLKNKLLMAVCRRGFSAGVALDALEAALDQVADD